MIEVKPPAQESVPSRDNLVPIPWAEAAAERRQEGAPPFYMGNQARGGVWSGPLLRTAHMGLGVCAREPGQVYACTLSHFAAPALDDLRGKVDATVLRA